MKNIIIQLPTHFRFKNPKEAKQWGVTTEDWNPIRKIEVENGYVNIAALHFSWIQYDKKKNNLEFSLRKHIYCKGCSEIEVNKIGEFCEECFPDDN
jgi:hypothetical protein